MLSIFKLAKYPEACDSCTTSGIQEKTGATVGSGVADGKGVCVGVGGTGVLVGVEVGMMGSSVEGSSSMGGGEESKDKSIVGLEWGVFVGLSVFVARESESLLEEELGSSGMNNEQAIVIIKIGNNKRIRVFTELGFIGLPTLFTSTI